MSVYSLHFARVMDLVAIERRLARAMLRDPSLLPPQWDAALRYAINLARIGWLRTPDGRDVPLADALNPFRRWLRDHLLEIFGDNLVPDPGRLQRLAPLVAIRTEIARQALLVRYANDFDAETLDREVCHKKLALVLGGGGGSGLAHLGMFSLLDRMGLVPDYLVGASMGALLGLLRALRTEYDPVATLLALPRRFDLTDIFRPFAGRTRYGFPGAFDMHLVPMATRTIRQILGTELPRFDALPIHLEIVATGVRSGIDVDQNRLERELTTAGQGGFTPWGLRDKVRIFLRVVRQLASNPRFLRQIVFNDEPGTQSMRVIDAVGFSCSVPGFLHFDLFDESPETARLLDGIFEEHGLFRLTDGGVVNNVPSRVAWESIQKGKLGGHRNAFIYALDAFAPVANRNAMFIPIQQLARPAVLANRPYSDYTRTLRTVPNPMNLAPGVKHLQRLVHNVGVELERDAPFIRRMMTPVPRFDAFREQLHLTGAVYAAAS